MAAPVAVTVSWQKTLKEVSEPTPRPNFDEVLKGSFLCESCTSNQWIHKGYYTSEEIFLLHMSPSFGSYKLSSSPYDLIFH